MKHTCICGSVIINKSYNIKKHLKTKKHIAFISHQDTLNIQETDNHFQEPVVYNQELSSLIIDDTALIRSSHCINNDRYYCACGSIILNKPRNIDIHRVSKKHKKWFQQKTLTLEDIEDNYGFLFEYSNSSSHNSLENGLCIINNYIESVLDAMYDRICSQHSNLGNSFKWWSCKMSFYELYCFMSSFELWDRLLDQDERDLQNALSKQGIFNMYQEIKYLYTLDSFECKHIYAKYIKYRYTKYINKLVTTHNKKEYVLTINRTIEKHRLVEPCLIKEILSFMI